MDKKIRRINTQEPISIMENMYHCPSSDFPKLSIRDSQASDLTRSETYSKKKYKRVSFNQNVYVINISRHKRGIRMEKNQKYNSVFEEDFKEEKKKNCVNCNIF